MHFSFSMLTSYIVYYYNCFCLISRVICFYLIIISPFVLLRTCRHWAHQDNSSSSLHVDCRRHCCWYWAEHQDRIYREGSGEHVQDHRSSLHHHSQQIRGSGYSRHYGWDLWLSKHSVLLHHEDCQWRLPMIWYSSLLGRDVDWMNSHYPRMNLAAASCLVFSLQIVFQNCNRTQVHSN